jgi:DNA-binding NtrC family response regulator
MMTEYASVETAEQALKRGAYDYITKPVDPDELSHWWRTPWSISARAGRSRAFERICRRSLPAPN